MAPRDCVTRMKAVIAEFQGVTVAEDVMSKPEQPSASAHAASCIVWAYRFAEDGTGTPIAAEEAHELAADGRGWIWVHVALADVRSRMWLAELAPISSLARDFMLDADEHLRLDIVGREFLGIVPDLQRDFAQPSEDIARLRFVMTDQVLVTARRKPLNAVELARRSVEQGRRFPAAMDLLDGLIDHFADAIGHLAETLGDQLDRIETRLFGPDLGDKAQQIGRCRFQAVRIHRQLGQMRTLFHRLELRANSAAPGLAMAIGALAQKLDALDHEIGSVYERARFLQEEVGAKSTAIANRRLLTLSVLTACILPPTLVTGFFGMNTKDLPFQHTDAGTWFAFAFAALAGVFSYVVLRRMRAL